LEQIIAKDFIKPAKAARQHPGVLRSLNCDGGHGFALLICLVMLLAPVAGGEALRGAWRYERFAVADGQWWRLLTAHFTHLDLHHALLNATGFALLWALFARCLAPRQWLPGLLLCVLAIDAGFWLWSTQLQWYVGASALLHGVFACGCVAWIRSGDRIGIVALVLLAAKLAWEQYSGPLPFMADRPVVTISHVYGALGGVLAGLLLRPQREPLY
jgi:rhomboid family GlyGly-CTERM serine protease